MSNKDLFKEAIADAKAVREAALANAKVALEEALAPRLQNMISAKLQEMDEDLDEAEDLEEVDFISANDKRNDSDKIRKRAIDASQMSENEDLEEDFDLSEILAELEAEEGLAEAKKKKDGEDDDKKLDEAEEEGEEEEDETEGGDEEGEEEEIDTEEPEIEDAPEETSGAKVEDLTVDELKDIIKDIISAEMGGAQGGGDEMDMDMGDMGGEEGGDEIAVDEMYMDEEDPDAYGGDMEEELDLEELLAELDALDESNDEDLSEIKRKGKKKAEEDDKEIKEAIATINTLRAELNEVNLLNAKLLYVNKIFKSKNLNESQKLKVIAQFDKATTAKEAKTIYESMSTAIAATSSTKKSSLKESIGFASKAAGIAPKKNIVEVDETMSRWQMLAGIKKF